MSYVIVTRLSERKSAIPLTSIVNLEEGPDNSARIRLINGDIISLQESFTEAISLLDQATSRKQESWSPL